MEPSTLKCVHENRIQTFKLTSLMSCFSRKKNFKEKNYLTEKIKVGEESDVKISSRNLTGLRSQSAVERMYACVRIGPELTIPS